MKLVGAGAGLGLGSGVATASDGDGHDGGDDGHGDGTRSSEHEIHPVFGKPLTSDEEPPEQLKPDHVVELHEDMPEGFPPAEDADEPPELAHPPFFHFEPVGLHVDEGDVVQFAYSTADHTVTAYHPDHHFQRRVPEGAEPFSAPIVPAEGSWLYQFDELGVYDLYCGPHHTFGMVMRIVVGDVPDDDLPAYVGSYQPEPPLLPPFSPEFVTGFFTAFADGQQFAEWPFLTPVDVFETSALDPANVQDAGEVPFATVAHELGYDAYDGHDEVPGATLTVDDQSGDGETLVVDAASASVDYYVDAHYDGESSKSEDFDADTTQTDLELELDPPIEDDTTVDVAVHAAEDGDELLSEETEYVVA